MDGLVTTLKYPRGTEFVSGVISEGTLSEDGLKWRGVNLTEGQTATLRLTVEITDESLFETGTKTIEAVTTKSHGEVIISNNIITKVIE
jgi:hypothetical protein